MITLDATNITLEVDLDAAVTANQLPIVSGFVDIGSSNFSVTEVGSEDTQTNDTTAVTAVTAPASGKTRQIKSVFIQNADTDQTTVTVQLNNNSTLRPLVKVVLQPDETLQYMDGEGWFVANKKKSYKSDVNSSTTPLGGAASFTGDWEDVTEIISIVVAGTADQAGTLFAEHSLDGSTTFESISLNDGTSGVFDSHILTPKAQFFRVRLVNGATPQGSLDLQTIYSDAVKILTVKPEESIGEFDHIQMARAIITGLTGINAHVTSDRALQVTPPPEGKAAFGEAAVEEPSPVVQVKFNYGLNEAEVIERANQSGSITVVNSSAVVSTGAAANSGAALFTKGILVYRPGQGALGRFTGLFTTGVANNSQAVGVGNAGEGFFFGYDGATFGVLHRSYGSPEIRTLTITTASSTAENVTVTLDGNALATVAVTASGNLTTTANEVAAADYSDVGPGWTAYAVGDTVVFESWEASVQTGSYSIAGTTVVGAFAQTVVGVAPTNDWIPQASWNGLDTFDGNGPSGVTLDPTKGNVFQIRFQYLGYGGIQFFIEDPQDGDLHRVHYIAYANANTRPLVNNPSFSLRVETTNTSNTSDITVESSSLAGFVEGDNPSIGPREGLENTITLATANETPIFSFGPKRVYGSVINFTQAKIFLASGAVEHNKPVSIKFYRNALLTDASFNDVDINSSGLHWDIAATAFSGGDFLFSIPLGRTGNEVVNFPELTFVSDLSPGEIITATALPVSGTGADATAAVYLVELI